MFENKFMDSGMRTYFYCDGTKVTYQFGDGDQIAGLEAIIGKNANSVPNEYKGFLDVNDSKDQPCGGKKL